MSLFIDEKENKSLIQDLRFGNLDIAITTPPEAHANILEIPVYVEKFVAYKSGKTKRSTLQKRRVSKSTKTTRTKKAVSPVLPYMTRAHRFSLI